MFACANLSFLFKEAGPLLARYGAASEAKFKFVEHDFPSGVTPNELGNAMRSSGVQTLLINCYQGSDGEMGFGATPGREDDFIDSLERTISFAKATQCKKLHILSGRDLGPDHLEKQLSTLEQNLVKASQILAVEGIIGLIEPINTFSKPNYFMNNYEKALRVIEKVNSPNIRLQLDLFHLQMIAGNVTNNIKRLLPYTGHIQVAQAPSRNEPSSAGELNMSYVFQKIQSQGYKGVVGCEYIPSSSSANVDREFLNLCGIQL